MADQLSGESGTAVDADYPRSGQKSEKNFRDERVYIIDNMDRVHMAHIWTSTMDMQCQWCCSSSHRDS